MTCPDENSLARLLDATLSDADRRAIERHLDTCSACSTLVSELAGLVAPIKTELLPTIDEHRGGGERPRRATADPVDTGRYRMRAEIARGGMGRVVEATDPVLGRIVAVKEAMSTDPEALRRFARETRITARLEHPSIVPVYDAGTTADGTPYYVMRKVSGQPLAQLVADADSVLERLALITHVVAAAHAVAHAHQRRIIHRDLKPSNILVGHNGETVVIDWGLAKVIDEPDIDDPHASASHDPGGSLRTRVGTVFGTPGFMPPEQVRGEAVDVRGDVYALGATLYYVLARQPPHASASEDDMLVAAATGPPVPIAHHVAGVPPELSTIIDKALAHDDQARYPDAGALAEDLQRFLTGQLVASHRYSRRERLARFVKRYRLSVAISTVATLAIAIGAWLAIDRVVSERDRADLQARLATDHAREAELRADEILVLQADTLTKTDPTVAVALVKQLRTPPERWQRMWHAARAVAAGARSQGVAWSMAAPSKPFDLSMSPSGDCAAATDPAGVVWVYDLPRHVGRALAAMSTARRAEFSDDDHLIMFQKDRAISVELAAGVERAYLDVTDVDQVELTPSTMFWTSHHVVRRTDLVTGTTTKIAETRNDWFALSRDQRWLAIIGKGAVLVVDTSSLDAAPRSLASTIEPALVTWAADSEHLAVTAAGHVGTASRRDAKIAWFPATGGDTRIPIFGGTQLYFGSLGLDVFADGGLLSVVGSIVIGTGMAVGSESCVVVASGSVIHAIGRGRDVVLEPPATVIQRIIAVPKGPYVVAGGVGRVFVWDLRDVLPRPEPIAKSSGYAMVGDHDLLVLGEGTMTWSWIETDTKRVTKFDEMTLLAQVAASSRDRAVVIDTGKTPSPALLLTKGRSEVEALDDDVLFAQLGDRDDVVFSTSRGAVVRYDLTTHRRTTVLQRDAHIDSMGNTGPWLAAAYANGLLVRRNLDTGVESEVRVAASHAQPTLEIQVLHDGRVCVPIDARVACWNVDGTMVDAVALPTSANLVERGPNRMLLVSGSAVYAVDFGNDRLYAAIPADARFSVSAAADIAVFETGRGGIDAVDLTTGARWQVVQGGDRKVRSPAISRDATMVFGIVDDDLASWNVEVARDPDAAARWLDRLTNATADRGPASLAWDPPAR